MSEEIPYEVNGDLVNIGKKYITVRCPRTMKAMLDSNLQYVPIAEYSKRAKDDETQNVVTFFNVKVLDKFYKPKAGESPRTFELRGEIPQSLSSSVYVENTMMGSVVKWDVSRAECRAFRDDWNDLLRCWFPVMAAKRDNLAAPVSFRDLSQDTVNLKWPWAKVAVDDYFEKIFRPDLNLHQFYIGVGYHNAKDSLIGISIGLSQFPGLTQQGAYLRKVEQSEKAKKKRKLISLDENGNEIADSVEANADSVDSGEVV